MVKRVGVGLESVGATFSPSIALSRPVRSVITVTLPKPLSVNNLFFNVPGKGRVPSFDYKRWKKEAAQEILIVQRPGHISGPVEIYIQVQEGRADLDGQIKCCLDALVDNGVIDGDGHKIVRKLIVAFGNVTGARIEIMHASEWTFRKIQLRERAS